MPWWLRICDILLLLVYIAAGMFLSAQTTIHDWSIPAMIAAAMAYGIFMIVSLNWILSSLPEHLSIYFRNDYKKNKDKS